MRFNLLAGLLLVLLGHAACAADLATPAEAKTFVEKAAAFLHENGPDRAFPMFNTATEPWHYRDMFVAVRDANGKFVAHGENAALIGLSVLDLRDVDGTPLTRLMLAIGDAGWVHYKWRDPSTNEVLPRVSYVVHVGDFWVEAGAYVR